MLTPHPEQVFSSCRLRVQQSSSGFAGSKRDSSMLRRVRPQAPGRTLQQYSQHGNVQHQWTCLSADECRCRSVRLSQTSNRAVGGTLSLCQQQSVPRLTDLLLHLRQAPSRNRHLRNRGATSSLQPRPDATAAQLKSSRPQPPNTGPQAPSRASRVQLQVQLPLWQQHSLRLHSRHWARRRKCSNILN